MSIVPSLLFHEYTDHTYGSGRRHCGPSPKQLYIPYHKTDERQFVTMTFDTEFANMCQNVNKNGGLCRPPILCADTTKIIGARRALPTVR